tara:strand:+ start:24888 stop:25535 length:648 start_codon:yes stop_codon:yes gene_type:complete
MTITKSTGLFYTERLETNEGVCRGVFCQPIDIDIYSAPYPAKHRVVSYRILHWYDCKQPDISVDMDSGEVFKSKHLGEQTFTFNTGTIGTTIENVTMLIRRHFLEVVAKGKPFKDLRESLRRLNGASLAKEEVTISDGRVAELNNVRHVEKIRHDNNFIYTFQQPVLIYNIAIINDPNKVGKDDLPTKRVVEKAYVSNRSLMSEVLNDFDVLLEQ